MKKFSIILFCILTLLGCATTASLSSMGKGVKLGKSDPDTACKELESLDIKNSWGTPTDSKNLLRNKAADLGANYVRLDSLTSLTIAGDNAGYMISGTAFKCPSL